MMVRRAITAGFASGAILASASPALAQGWTGGPMPRQGACFYQDINFRGQYFCVEAGENLDAMPSGSNDRVSSIRVLGRTEVTVYADQRFRGASLRLDANTGDLQAESFNDLISSVQVRSTGVRWWSSRPGRTAPVRFAEPGRDCAARIPGHSGTRSRCGGTAPVSQPHHRRRVDRAAGAGGSAKQSRYPGEDPDESRGGRPARLSGGPQAGT